MDWSYRPDREEVVCGKFTIMKPIFRMAILGGALLAAQTGKAQFSGKLVYQVDGQTSRLIMTYYQQGTTARMKAYNVNLSNGTVDMSTLKAQDTILYDFAAAHETHLQYKTG